MGSRAVGTVWRRLPAGVRAVLGGLFVFAALQIGWNALVVANIAVSPQVPWAVPLTLVYLWVVFQFFNGRWGAEGTRTARRRRMRARRLDGGAWRRAVIPCVAVFFFTLSFAMLGHRLIAIPEDPALPAVPWWTLYPMLIMISIVAGVSEEAGFRGYMQGALESRHGAWIAIGVTSLMFWVLHLNHPSGFARFPSLFLAGVMFGTLTYATSSILPAMVTHVVIDIVAFVGTVAGFGPESLWAPPRFAETGFDPGFAATLAVAIVSGAAFVGSLRPMLRYGRPPREALAR